VVVGQSVLPAQVSQDVRPVSGEQVGDDSTIQAGDGASALSVNQHVLWSLDGTVSSAAADIMLGGGAGTAASNYQLADPTVQDVAGNAGTLTVEISGEATGTLVQPGLPETLPLSLTIEYSNDLQAITGESVLLSADSLGGGQG
jgi:hypothetical protein